jgi:4-diphosphocytidyl-2-C-methyl-D-erythritol kinase
VASVRDIARGLAKLTVRLSVVGVRADGYHLLDAEMVTLAHHDVLTIGAGDGVEIVGRFAAGVPADEANLVRRALAAVGRQAHVVIDKRIPPGAGLGGGSADAAAVLRWAGCTDVGIATALGADVPFCVVGGRAHVTGVGEHVNALEFVERAYTLCTPPFGVSTPAVYRMWDELGGPTGATNDLEAAALVVAPELATWRDRLGDATGVTPVLAGSGSTWFVNGTFAGLDVALAPATVVVTRTDRP